jgi:predicted alpha/beta superfamily hydrolase
MNNIDLVLLERMMLVSKDTKKEFSYNKHSGKWSWKNRDEEESTGEFDSFFQALSDAVEPYFSEKYCWLYELDKP